MESQKELDIEVKTETEDHPPLDPNAVCPDPDEDIIKNYKLALNNKLVDKANDIHEKLLIAKNILEACENEAEHEETVRNSHINKLQYFTKQPFWYLNEVIRDDNTSRSLTLKQVIKDTMPIPPDIIPNIYSDIRDIFITTYVKNKQMPSIVDFMECFHNKRDDGFYKNAKISTLVKNNLVKCHHLTKLNRFILMENPKFAYQRHLYLRQIIGHRSRGTNIVYVTVKVRNTDKGPMFLAFAASSTAGLISKTDSSIGWSPTDAYEKGNGNEEVKFWIRNKLLPKLSPSSVIVLTQLHKKKAPTPFSTREEMLFWLNKQDIPCDPETHKAQLYNLVKIYKKNEKETGHYEVMASAGFNVVICPIEYPSLDFFNDIHSNVTGNISVNAVKLMTKLSQEEWTMMEEKIIQEEKQMMKDDEEMEKIVANLLQMMKNGDLKEEDFPYGCEGTKSDNYAIHIGDVIVD